MFTRVLQLCLGLAAILAGVIALPCQGSAAVLRVEPVLMELKSGQGALALHVSDPSDHDMSVQVRVFRWTQAGGVDVDTPTEEIGFSPPIFHLAPGARQVIRLVRLGSTPPGVELAYRVYVDQIPGPGVPGILQMPVRMVLPLFVAPHEIRKAELQWTAKAALDGQTITLTASNSGNVRRRLRDLTAGRSADKRVDVAGGLAGYVLAGRARSWSFKLPPANANANAAADAGAALAVSVLCDDRPTRITVPVSR